MTRFVVMAMLQAARARTLGLPRDSAVSWGLNRAIFYAAAKRGFRESPPTSDAAAEAGPEKSARKVYRLGDETAFRDSRADGLIFVIGDKEQTTAEFERSVSSRFGTAEHFRSAWDEAMRLMAEFDRATLESRQRFYAEVYQPRRDNLSDEWTRKYSPPPKKK